MGMGMGPIVSGRTPEQIREDPSTFDHGPLYLRFGSAQPRTPSGTDSLESTRREFSALAVAPQPQPSATQLPDFVADAGKFLASFGSFGSYGAGQENKPSPQAPAPFDFASVQLQKQENPAGVSEGDTFKQVAKSPFLGPSAGFADDEQEDHTPVGPMIILLHGIGLIVVG